jgi:hypothetical protein
LPIADLVRLRAMTVRERVMFVLVMAVGAVVFFCGDGWGLPSRAADRFLFSSGNAWSGKEIVEKGGNWAADRDRAADADANPILDRSTPVWLNQTDRQKAEILRRYRLYSAQPDEMVTFMALAGMRPSAGNFDPRMYQYGGMWIYPVGAMLKIASTAGLVTVRPDLDFYLDHPEQFARFYVVTRIYSGLWGLVGVWAAFHLARRFSANRILPGAVAACFVFLPIVINGTHEAKPHLAGAVLVMLSAQAGTKYVETGARRWWIVTGVMCGTAAGMVLSAGVALIVIPLMVVLRPANWEARIRAMVGAGIVAVLVYCMTNPYVPIHLLHNPDVLKKNLGALGQANAIVGKSSDIGAVANARRLVTEGASLVGGVIGVTGLLVAAANRAWWARPTRGRVVAILLGLPAAAVLIQFTLLAGGKPGEFGRFAILPDVALMMTGVIFVASTKWGRLWPWPMMASMVLLVGFQGMSYWAGFVDDSSRRLMAARLEELWKRGARTLGVRAEPAPYCLPPVDVGGWKIVLLPADDKQTGLADVIGFPVDEVERNGRAPGTSYDRAFIAGQWPWLKTRISWADKPFEIRVRRDLGSVSPDVKP